MLRCDHSCVGNEASTALAVRGNRYDKQVACSSVLIGPSTVLSRVCYLSGSILRGFDPLTMVSYPRSTCLLVRRFPAHAPHVPLRANRYAQGLFMFVTCAPCRVRPTGRERLGTDSFILSVGCSQPGHLAPERTPVVETAFDIAFQYPLRGNVSCHDGKTVFHRIGSGPPWPKSIGVGTGRRFRDGVQCQQIQGLHSSTFHHGTT